MFTFSEKVCGKAAGLAAFTNNGFTMVGSGGREARRFCRDGRSLHANGEFLVTCFWFNVEKKS